MYVILWRFQTRTGMSRDFEEAYGAAGEWARFFARGVGYLGTELHPDPTTSGRYVTIDRWESKDAYERFRAANRSEYDRIDARCEALTDDETLIGRFDSADSI